MHSTCNGLYIYGTLSRYLLMSPLTNIVPVGKLFNFDECRFIYEIVAIYGWPCMHTFGMRVRNLKLHASHIRISTHTQCNWLVAQIPQRNSPISHNVTFSNRNVHMCAHFCYKMVHSGTFVWCPVGYVRWVYSAPTYGSQYTHIYSACPVYPRSFAHNLCLALFGCCLLRVSLHLLGQLHWHWAIDMGDCTVNTL